MFFSTKGDRRPYHLGAYPLEALPRDDGMIAVEAARRPAAAPEYLNPAKGPLARSLRTYLDILSKRPRGRRPWRGPRCPTTPIGA